MKKQTLFRTVGLSYLVIFFAAIFANFFALEAMKASPLETVQNEGLMVRLGIIAFLITVVFDVVVAWALNEIYKKNVLNTLSTYFRLTHAVIMGAAIFALPFTLAATTDSQILSQIQAFDTLWLIGLFFFGFHLILLGKIMDGPKIIAGLLMLAGLMYIFDTCAHFVYADYELHADLFLALVAVPSILGEMSFAIWMLRKKR